MSESISGIDSFFLWSAFQRRMVWRRVVERGGDAAVAEGAVANEPAVTALEALAANRAIVDDLMAARWWVMQVAREDGASWSEIGAALGMTKQGAADWYRRKIADQEKYVPDFHDAERARAAL